MADDPFAICAAEVRRYDPDRFFSTLFAPDKKRRYLFALYAFNLAVASIGERIREPLMGAMRLQWWREVLDQSAAGHVPVSPVADALARTLVETGLPIGPLQALIDARLCDLEPTPMATAEALRAYAEATASTLVASAVHILAPDRAIMLREAARNAGLAFAYAGYIRAFGYQARRGRHLVPESWLATEGLSKADILNGAPPPKLAPIAARFAAEARTAIDELRGALRVQDPGAAWPAFLPASLVGPVLARIERRWDLFDPRLNMPRAWRVLRLLVAGTISRV